MVPPDSSQGLWEDGMAFYISRCWCKINMAHTHRSNPPTEGLSVHVWVGGNARLRCVCLRYLVLCFLFPVFPASRQRWADARPLAPHVHPARHSVGWVLRNQFPTSDNRSGMGDDDAASRCRRVDSTALVVKVVSLSRTCVICFSLLKK